MQEQRLRSGVLYELLILGKMEIQGKNPYTACSGSCACFLNVGCLSVETLTVLAEFRLAWMPGCIAITCPHALLKDSGHGAGAPPSACLSHLRAQAMVCSHRAG